MWLIFESQVSYIFFMSIKNSDVVVSTPGTTAGLTGKGCVELFGNIQAVYAWQALRLILTLENVPFPPGDPGGGG
jgi:hypothetical protein